jgi:hypothetical protein
VRIDGPVELVIAFEEEFGCEIPEEAVQTRDRGTRWVRTTKMPITGPDGRPQYLLGISEEEALSSAVVTDAAYLSIRTGGWVKVEAPRLAGVKRPMEVEANNRLRLVAGRGR